MRKGSGRSPERWFSLNWKCERRSLKKEIKCASSWGRALSEGVMWVARSCIRSHWGGCEIRNHWVRDAIFEEDSTRSKNVNLNGNLAILRGALVALKALLVPDRS